MQNKGKSRVRYLYCQVCYGWFGKTGSKRPTCITCWGEYLAKKHKK